ANIATGATVASSVVGFAEIMSWTQSMATNGMMSVVYPTVYSSFSQNFAWSTAMVSWASMQEAIDSMRSKTNGNTTLSSWTQLKASTIVDYESGAVIFQNTSSTTSTAAKLVRRLTIDGITFTEDSSTTGDSTALQVLTTVAGIGRYINHIMIPSANTFMTILLFFAIIIGVVVCGMISFRLFIEIWNIMGTLPHKLDTFRRRYWSLMIVMILRIIMILYGTWVLYCLYQFRLSDSWASLVLAAVTLGIFTAILVGFTIRIFVVARRANSSPDGIESLYQHKPWVRWYGLFYGQFKTQFWWFFVIMLAASFSRSAFTALADGHGMVQVIGQIVVEVLLFLALVAIRPFNRRSGNVVNSIISVVRIVSLACILVFVEELGIEAETSTIVGIVLIVLQAALTILLVVLMIIQALMALFLKSRPNKALSAESELQPFEESKMPIIAIESEVNRPFLTHTLSSSAVRSNPWDEYVDNRSAGTADKSLLLSTVPTAHASSDDLLPIGLQHDKNGRPIF
ncbi:TRP-like family, partial [Limtongia smithiae]|uniref:TRP-like family n=1 Tax=Limtongia smithiae TaxID=1125753 RepID=UPI0034CF94BC